MKRFKKQIQEDINRIQADWSDTDLQLVKNEYAFNYWVLSKLYNVEEELIPNYIVYQFSSYLASFPELCSAQPQLVPLFSLSSFSRSQWKQIQRNSPGTK